MQFAVELSYRRYFRDTRLVQRFPEALRLAGKTNDDAASSDSASPRDALGFTHLENAVLFSAEEHDVLLFIKAATAHNQGRKHKLPFNGLALYSIPPHFSKSSELCTALRVKIIPPTLTSFYSSSFCRPRAALCRQGRRT